MCKTMLRFCSVLLVVVLLANMLPLSTFAAELQARAAETESTAAAESTVVSSTVKTAEEIIENRTKYTKEFKLSGGLHMAVVYPEAVHYEEDGQWKEIDNTLRASGAGTKAAYTNTAGVWDVSFPQSLRDGSAVTITKDGYTLSFAMAGQLSAPTGGLSTMAIGSENASFSVESAKLSAAQVQKIDLSAAKAEAEYPETVPDKLYSRLQYTGVYSNTDIIYDLQSNQVKESVVLSSYSADLRGYRYTLNVGRLIPVLDSSGRIDLYDENRESIIMTLPAPYMVDSAGAYNDDVTVTLEGRGSTYTLCYILPQSWLADSSRQWPVILDPIVDANVDVNNISDVTVYELSTPLDYQSGVLDWGHNTSFGIMRSFVKYNSLPTLTSADVVVGAMFRVYKPNNSSNATVAQIHKVNTTWESSAMNWGNQPGHSPIVEDFATVQNIDYYGFDVTDIVRGWYEGENTGLLIRASDEIENTTSTTSYRKQFYSSDYSIYQHDQKPYLQILFRNNNGLESYWDYTASSAGRAGTGYVNNYTGNLVWVRSDLGFGGTRMPVAISHVYNANDAANNAFGTGSGWRTTFNQRVSIWNNRNSTYYVWEDSDGTKHYFYNESGNTYKDEDGLELTLTVTNTSTLECYIADQYENRSYFDAYGRLTKQENNQQTKSSINITYTTDTGFLINTVTDGVGRVYAYSYNGSGLLSRISYRGKGSSELSYVSYGYSGTQLTTVTDQDGKSTSYTYANGNLLASAQDIDSYKLTYEYTTHTPGKPSRVRKLCEFDGAKPGSELDFSYGNNQTVITDYNGNKQIYQFNNWGNTVAVYDGEGRAQLAQYAFTDAEDEKNNTDATRKTNQLRQASNLQYTVTNWVWDMSFEGYSTWNNASGMSNVATGAQRYSGLSSLQISGPGEYVSDFQDRGRFSVL